MVRESGGFIDYFQLLFDEHQIIYAEGIAAETLLVDLRTQSALPSTGSSAMRQPLSEHAHRPHLDFEVEEELARQPGIAAILRRASMQ